MNKKRSANFHHIPTVYNLSTNHSTKRQKLSHIAHSEVPALMKPASINKSMDCAVDVNDNLNYNTPQHKESKSAETVNNKSAENVNMNDKDYCIQLFQSQFEMEMKSKR